MNEVKDDTKQKVAELLAKYELLKFAKDGEEGFKLKSGIISPFYIDLRQAQSFPDLFHAITDAYCEAVGDVEQGVFLSGIPEAGTPLATAVGFQLHAPLIQPRKVIKDHGTGKSIEGAFTKGSHVIVIDDLITKGDSKLEAIKQFTDNGLTVDRFVVLIDREQGGAQTLSDSGYSVSAVMGITDLITRVSDSGLITKEQCKTILDFINS